MLMVLQESLKYGATKDRLKDNPTGGSLVQGVTGGDVCRL